MEAYLYTTIDWPRRWWFLLIALAVIACNEDPSQELTLVSPVPLENVTFRDTTIEAVGGLTAKKFLSMEGPANLVGRSGDYTAYLPLQFYPSYFPARDTINVLSATLSLRSASFFGDSTAPFGFTVHRIERGWLSYSLTWDSVQMGFFDPSVVRGSFNGWVGPDTEKIAIALDTTMVREWLATPTATTTTKYGIVLIPNSTCNVVRGFATFENDSSSYFPTLQVISSNAAGTVIDTMTFRVGMDTFVGNIDNLNTRQDLLYAQAGVVYRSIVKFDVSFIPKGSTIHRAELLLERDPATSRLNRFSGDSSIMGHLMLSEGDIQSYEGSSTTGTRKEGTSTTYSLDARHVVQSWIRGTQYNFGMLLRVNGIREFSSFDLLTFFSAEAEQPRRPKLKIIYSTVTK